MFAYEFNSVVNNGAIVIPEKYRDMIRSDMRVIVFASEQKGDTKPISFSALQLHTKGIKFNREIANER